MGGIPGLVVIIDEAETILRMRRDVRGKSLNGIRQIIDDTPQYKGLLWVFTGTPEFFDAKILEVSVGKFRKSFRINCVLLEGVEILPQLKFT